MPRGRYTALLDDIARPIGKKERRRQLLIVAADHIELARKEVVDPKRPTIDPLEAVTNTWVTQDITGALIADTRPDIMGEHGPATNLAPRSQAPVTTIAAFIAHLINNAQGRRLKWQHRGFGLRQHGLVCPLDAGGRPARWFGRDLGPRRRGGRRSSTGPSAKAL